MTVARRSERSGTWEPGVRRPRGGRGAPPRHLQHQQVLRQNVGNLVGRDAKFGDADRQAAHETALAGQPHATVLEHAVAPLPAIRRTVRNDAAALENGFLKFTQGGDRAEGDRHADHGHRLGCFANGRRGYAPAIIETGRRFEPVSGSGRSTRRPLFQQHVTVDATETEGADRGAAWTSVGAVRPGFGRRLYPERTRDQGTVIGRVFEIERRR